MTYYKSIEKAHGPQYLCGERMFYWYLLTLLSKKKKQQQLEINFARLGLCIESPKWHQLKRLISSLIADTWVHSQALGLSRCVQMYVCSLKLIEWVALMHNELFHRDWIQSFSLTKESGS